MSRLGFIYNMDQCIGCKACQMACKDKNHLGVGEFFRRVDTIPVGEEYVHFSGSCNHCLEPVCVKNCPTSAMHVAEDGTVLHDAGKCIGCGNCVWSCPYGAVQLSKQKGTAIKCGSCYDLRAKGQKPACVQACVTRCLDFGEIEDEMQTLPGFLKTPEITNPSLKIISKDKEKQIVIIGNGIAGLTVAEKIREQDHTSKIVLIGEEREYTYSRPMITKAPLVGFDKERFTVKSKDWYEQKLIKAIVNTKVVELDTKNMVVVCENGEKFRYDQCVLATGAESFIPPLKGIEKKGVFVVRKLEDIEKIRKHRLVTSKAIVIGGGVIGLEMAWELKKTGLEVVILEREKAIMERLLDRQSQEVLTEIIQKEGIQVFTDVGVRLIDGSGKVESVTLEDGRTFDAQMVILSCGIKANTEVAEKASLSVGIGILVNEKMETSQKNIYACGDCAEFRKSNLAIWDESVRQATVVAKQICGEKECYDQIKGTVLFNGMHTSMVILGDAGKNPEKEYVEVVKEGIDQNGLYQVNRKGNGFTYSKYFFSKNCIVGAVLIGDLSTMYEVKKAIDEKVSYESFMRQLDK